mmetsp:Transcript_5745/g.16401  ORF Transcript_5745/g.16401 Transcript_5745/m.16401 type:complete len:613 (-) Transcript_5745:2065-3903(-)
MLLCACSDSSAVGAYGCLCDSHIQQAAKASVSFGFCFAFPIPIPLRRRQQRRLYKKNNADKNSNSNNNLFQARKNRSEADLFGFVHVYRGGNKQSSRRSLDDHQWSQRNQRRETKNGRKQQQQQQQHRVDNLQENRPEAQARSVHQSPALPEGRTGQADSQDVRPGRHEPDGRSVGQLGRYLLGGAPRRGHGTGRAVGGQSGLLYPLFPDCLFAKHDGTAGVVGHQLGRREAGTGTRVRESLSVHRAGSHWNGGARDFSAADFDGTAAAGQQPGAGLRRSLPPVESAGNGPESRGRHRIGGIPRTAQHGHAAQGEPPDERSEPPPGSPLDLWHEGIFIFGGGFCWCRRGHGGLGNPGWADLHSAAPAPQAGRDEHAAQATPDEIAGAPVDGRRRHAHAAAGPQRELLGGHTAGADSGCLRGERRRLRHHHADLFGRNHCTGGHAECRRRAGAVLSGRQGRVRSLSTRPKRKGGRRSHAGLVDTGGSGTGNRADPPAAGVGSPVLDASGGPGCREDALADRVPDSRGERTRPGRRRNHDGSWGLQGAGHGYHGIRRKHVWMFDLYAARKTPRRDHVEHLDWKHCTANRRRGPPSQGRAFGGQEAEKIKRGNGW